jgi:hypothetical protein
MTSEVNFVRQQGFRGTGSQECVRRYPALMWQPRFVGALLAPGIVLQSWRYFAALGALLCWSALVPRLNPFDASYNALVARRQGLPRLAAAPGPRRFAQGMASTFALLIAVSLARGWSALAWGFEALLVVALAALIFGRFCLGSYVFLLLSGQRPFANSTLPWARPEQP